MMDWLYNTAKTMYIFGSFLSKQLDWKHLDKAKGRSLNGAIVGTQKSEQTRSVVGSGIRCFIGRARWRWLCICWIPHPLAPLERFQYTQLGQFRVGAVNPTHLLKSMCVCLCVCGRERESGGREGERLSHLLRDQPVKQASTHRKNTSDNPAVVLPQSSSIGVVCNETERKTLYAMPHFKPMAEISQQVSRNSKVQQRLLLNGQKSIQFFSFYTENHPSHTHSVVIFCCLHKCLGTTPFRHTSARDSRACITAGWRSLKQLLSSLSPQGSFASWLLPGFCPVCFTPKPDFHHNLHCLVYMNVIFSASRSSYFLSTRKCSILYLLNAV